MCSAKLATILVSSLPLWSWLLARPLGFSLRRVPEKCPFPDDPLVAFRSSPEYDHSGAATAGSLPVEWLPPLRFLPLRRLKKRAATYLPGSTASRVRVPSQRFYALKAFIRPQPAGLVSCRQRPWGSPFRVRPSAEPNALSSAATLLWLAEASTSGSGARQMSCADQR